MEHSKDIKKIMTKLSKKIHTYIRLESKKISFTQLKKSIFNQRRDRPPKYSEKDLTEIKLTGQSVKI